MPEIVESGPQRPGDALGGETRADGRILVYKNLVVVIDKPAVVDPSIDNQRRSRQAQKDQVVPVCPVPIFRRSAWSAIHMNNIRQRRVQGKKSEDNCRTGAGTACPRESEMVATKKHKRRKKERKPQIFNRR